MKNRTIAWSQLSAVLLLALLPLGTELLPGRLAQVGAAAWLCPLLAGVGVVALGLLVSRRCPPGRRDWGQRVTRRWGRRTARVLAGAFLLWGLFLAAAHAERIGSRLSDSLRAAPVLLTAAVLLLAGWMAAGGAARLCPGLRGLSPGGGGGVRGDPPLWHLPAGLVPHLALDPGGAGPGAGRGPVHRGDHGDGGVCPLPPGGCAAGGRGADGMLRRLALLFALLAGAVLLVLGQLGSALAAQVGPALLQMVSGLGFEGAFQRLEELVSALWVLGDVALLGLLLLCLGRLLAWLLDRPVGKGKSWLLTGAVFLLGLPAALGDHPLAGDLGALWEPGGGGPPGADPAGNGGRKKVGKKRKKGLTFLDGAWYSIKAVARQGRKSRRKEEKTS